MDGVISLSSKMKILMKFHKMKVLNAAKNIILFASFGYFLYFINGNAAEFSRLKNFNIFIIFLIIFLKYSGFHFLSLMNLHVLKNINVDVNKIISLSLTSKNALGNLSLPLKLGAGYKFYYLKKNYSFKTAQYFYLWTFISLVNLFPIIIIAFIIYAYSEQFNLSQALFIILALLVPLFFLIKLTTSWNYLEKLGAIKSFKYFSRSNINLQIFHILFYLTESVTIFIIFNHLDSSISYFSAFAYIVLSIAINLVNITPGNIGVKEGLIILLSGIHGISYEIVIIASLIERFFSFVVLFGIEFVLNKKLKIDI